MKRIAWLLVLASACKTTDSAPTPATDPAPAENMHPQKRGPAPNLAPDQVVQAAPGGEDGRPRHGPKDTDGDGKISSEERAAAHRERTEKIRAKWDTNGDGKLTVEEVAAVQGGMRFADPAALDTNKDGDISADELNAGMEARRAEMRAQRIEQGGGPGGADGRRPRGPVGGPVGGPMGGSAAPPEGQ